MGKTEAQARRRAEVILKVRAGVLTASEAAKELGVSRKTYYKWEQRALAGMLEGLLERSSGRPRLPSDPEKDHLKQRIQELEQEVRRRDQSAELRDLLKDVAEKKE